MFAVYSTIAIGRNEIWEGDEQISDWFGDVPKSFFTAFQVLTLEGWPDIARHVLDQQPWQVIPFVLFVMITSWGVLNLVTAIVVEKTTEATAENTAEIAKRTRSIRRKRKLQLIRIFAMMDECVVHTAYASGTVAYTWIRCALPLQRWKWLADAR